MATNVNTFCFSLICVMALAAASPSYSAGFWPRHEDPVSDSDPGPFSCTEVGKFSLDSNCTHFIDCSSNLTATLVACPSCEDVGSEFCPEGHWHFDVDKKECNWPGKVKCGNPPPTPPPRPVLPDPGTPCEPKCMQPGECKCYLTCEPDGGNPSGGQWVRRYCDDDLFWNPNINLWPHGGSCDFWINLSPAVQAYYRSLGIDECPVPKIPCEWKEHGHCQNWYWFLPDGTYSGNRWELLKCPRNPLTGEQTWWNQAEKRCSLTCPKPNGCYLCQ